MCPKDAAFIIDVFKTNTNQNGMRFVRAIVSYLYDGDVKSAMYTHSIFGHQIQNPELNELIAATIKNTNDD